MEKVRERGSGGPERRLAFRDGAGEPRASPAGSPSPSLAVPAGFFARPSPGAAGWKRARAAPAIPRGASRRAGLTWGIAGVLGGKTQR